MPANDRLRTAMLRAGLEPATLGARVGVDAKTVNRWIGGRVPHQRNRFAVAEALDDDASALWPSTRPDLAPGFVSTGEVVAAWAHRADIPSGLWTSLFTGARHQIDILGYAAPFVREMSTVAVITRLCEGGARVRIALADPDCEHVVERDQLEQLGGTLPGRIRNALHMLADIAEIDGVQIGLHPVHLYNAIYRFDDQMIVTPYLFRARGYQHPALHLRKLTPFGIFESFAGQFEQVWGTVRMREVIR